MARSGKSKRKNTKDSDHEDDGGSDEEYEGEEHDEESNAEEDGDGSSPPPPKPTPTRQTRKSARKQKMRATFDTLHKEMEVAQYSKGASGQLRRVVPQNQRRQKTRKRNQLLREDYEIAEPEEAKKTRLRGSMMSLEGDVLEASLPLVERTADFIEAAAQAYTRRVGDVTTDADTDTDGGNLTDGGMMTDGGNLTDGGGNLTDGNLTEMEELVEEAKGGRKRGPYRKKAGKKLPGPTQSRRRLFRLKNFRSYKMAQRHGHALGAHARGQHRLAIAQLRAVAKDAPSAPQVYSSLGMVYHDMYETALKKFQNSLRGNRKQSTAAKEDQEDESEKGKDQQSTTTADDDEKEEEDPLLECLQLAQKSYGSYHICAILCKKDFTLWVRASDTACDIAALYGLLRAQQLERGEARPARQSRRQQEHWYGEAKNDLQTADNLKPPGLDVAIKLVSLNMELGMFSEAITLWTDLLNRGATQDFRPAAWLLYADGMLQIGHECRKWSGGDHSNRNYMFRRWLRKFAGVFDHEERRLQALVLGLESAAGSASCAKVRRWMQQRRVEIQNKKAMDSAKESAAVAFAEALVGDGGKEEEVEEEEEETKGNGKEDQEEENEKEEEEGNESSIEKASKKDPDEADDEEEPTERSMEEDKMEDGPKETESSPEKRKKNDASTADSDKDMEDVDEDQKQYASKEKIADVDDDEDDADDDEPTEVQEEDPTENGEEDENDDYPSPDNEFQKEKKLLVQQNKAELSAFDSTSENMLKVLGKDTSKTGRQNKSKAYEERRGARRKMVRYHRAQLSRLAAEYNQKPTGEDDSKKDGKPHSPQQESNSKSNPENTQQDLAMASGSGEEYHKPIGASIRVVCAIACQLIKHMMRMKLYRGGQLVGEAVSLYMKERARIHDKKKEARRRQQRQLDPLGRLFDSGPGPGFGTETEADSSDDEDASPYLSDDDRLDADDDDDDGENLLESLRRGVLPPEVSVLYATSLIHVGGRDFIAKKCIESIDQLEQETVSWLTETVSNTSLASSEQWQFCCAKATAPFGKTAAYAFLAETLRGTPKEAEWSEYLAPLFRGLMNNLQENGLTNALVDPSVGQSISSRFRIQQVLKSITSWSRLQIASAKSAYLEARKSGGLEQARAAKASVIDVFKLMKKLLHISSSQSLLITGDGGISDDCKEILNVFAEGYSLLMKDDDSPLDNEMLEELANECDEVISWFCQKSRGEQQAAGNSTIFDSTEWDKVPLPSTWQSNRHKAISLLSYNLCAAFNVSHFSGWDPNEFSLRLMKTRASCTYFGLQIKDGKVAGFVPSFVEGELSRQWERLGDYLPAAEEFRFNIKLAETKNLHWYKSGYYKHKEALEEEPIATNVEQPALKILLSHSKACLDLAKDQEMGQRYELLMTSLSVLLPITQFCLDTHVWNSLIGKAAAYDDTNLEGWRQATRKQQRAKKESTTKRKRTPKEPARPLDEWFPGEDRHNPLHNAVAIPVSALQRLWGRFDDATKKPPSTYARRAMRKVHDAMEKLRKCYTDGAVERASLQVACALLDLASVNKTCDNPFVVLQQAAIFASHGTKRGTSDTLFREPLPSHDKCTPHEALVILGRADCFQSVYFPYEAAYLCAFVARVCSLHRWVRSEEDASDEEGRKFESKDVDDKKEDADEATGKWSNQWMVVGILCYNVSIMIRATAVGKLGGLRLKEDYDPWDKDIIDELLLARADAMAWKSSLNRGHEFTHKDCSRKAPTYYNPPPMRERRKEESEPKTTSASDLMIVDEPGVPPSAGDLMIVDEPGVPPETSADTGEQGGEVEAPPLDGGGSTAAKD